MASLGIADTSVVSQEFNVSSTHDGPRPAPLIDDVRNAEVRLTVLQNLLGKQALDHKGRVLGQAQMRYEHFMKQNVLEMRFEHFMKAQYHENFMKAEFLANPNEL